MNANLETTIDHTTSSGITSSIEHKTLQGDGYDIHYFVSGQHHDQAIVFLHPAFSDHRAFGYQLDYFSQHYRVITIDLIGHGLSKANKSKDKIDASPQHILRILDMENIKRTHIVGVSMGSLIAQYFAFKHPDRVASLTALGGYIINKKNKEVAKAQRSSNIGLVLRALFSMNSFRKKTALITCVSEKGQALFYKASSRYERKSFSVMQGLQHVIKDRKNVVINYPSLIMTGEYDIELAQKMALEWHQEEKSSEHAMIKNGGHCANMDEPEAFNKRLNAFITKHD